MASLVHTLFKKSQMHANSRRDGCTTEKVLANIKLKLDDVTELDGLEELKYIIFSPRRN